MDKGILYIVATPIGNMEDIGLRALRILGEVDLIVCEDTRVTKKILGRYEIKTPVMSYHQHSDDKKTQKIIDEIGLGKNVALVTDAGTPGISDPGNVLVEKSIEDGISVSPIPGASALATIASVSGINMQRFVFMAFPPHKKGRNKFFQEIADSKYPVIYYESPHRVLKNLELLRGLNDGKQLVVGRELTKMFEEVVRGEIGEVADYFKEKNKIKGEFVIIAY